MKNLNINQEFIAFWILLTIGMVAGALFVVKAIDLVSVFQTAGSLANSFGMDDASWMIKPSMSLVPYALVTFVCSIAVCILGHKIEQNDGVIEARIIS